MGFKYFMGNYRLFRQSIIFYVKQINQISELVVTYKNKSINNLSTSYIKIRNIGNDTLDVNDFPELNRLSLVTTGVFLINSIDKLEITKSDKYMKTNLSLISPNKIEISFDYFDPKNEISFSIFHTGHIIVCGSIKNGKMIDNPQIAKIDHYKLIIRILIAILTIMLIIIIYLLNSS